ncbi:MAG: glycosyltransferase [Candidatus Binatia bacterium]
MKLLVLAASYPHPGHPYSGVFNERSVHALSKICETVEVLAPRPYVPPLVSAWVPRWNAYRAAPEYQSRNGTLVMRPSTPVFPRWGGALWVDRSAFLWCRGAARSMHRRTLFDAVLSFDLIGAGGLAWRIGRDLGIPATGWATGSDIRVPRSSSFGRSVIRALERLHVVFYQSHELREKAAGLLGVSPERMSPERHLVLPRGVPEPPVLARAKIRNHIRTQLKIADDAILVLSSGRISRAKGIFELLEAASIVAARNPAVIWAVLGSCPAFDETAEAQRKLDDTPCLRDRVRLIPACPSDQVWEYLCAADIFAFTSHREGMPNSLLEAMAMEVPVVAFDIPAVEEIDSGRKNMVRVPLLDSAALARAIIQLAASPGKRADIGAKGKQEVRDRFLAQKNMATAVQKIDQTVEQYRACRSCLHANEGGIFTSKSSLG